MKSKTTDLSKKAFGYFSGTNKQHTKEQLIKHIPSVFIFDTLFVISQFLDRKTLSLFILTCKYFSTLEQIIEIRDSKLFLGKQTPIRTGEEHTFFITKRKEMWVCGLNHMKRQGLPETFIKNITKNTTNFLEKGDSIKEISTGVYHTLLLSKNGTLFGCGSGSSQELGMPDKSQTKKFIKCDTSFLHPQETIISIAAGDRYSLLLSSEGRLFGCGETSISNAGRRKIISFIIIETFTELKIPSLLENEKIISINAKKGKSVLYTDKKRALLNEAHWEKVDFFKNISVPLDNDDYITQVALGVTGVLVLTYNNRLYVKGNNECGQLGLSHSDKVKDFQLCNISCLEKNETISRIESGDCHSLILTNKNRLLVCGYNKYGQLGLSHKENINSFEVCELTSLQAKEKIVAMDAGDAHTVIYTSMKRYLSCGLNEKHQLGILEDLDSQPKFSACVFK